MTRDVGYAMLGGLGLMAFVVLCFVVPPFGYAVFIVIMFGLFWFFASIIAYGVIQTVREEREEREERGSRTRRPIGGRRLWEDERPTRWIDADDE